MSKAFVREDSDGEHGDVAVSVPPPLKNYMTRRGFAALQAELKSLVEAERPSVVQTVAWAAANGDRSENADYLYGKKRLREIDRRIRYLVKRLESARVVDPADQRDAERVYFGATVTLRDDGGVETTYQIVGIDEADARLGRISWISPLAKALLQAREGDLIRFATPAGVREAEIVEVRYV